MKASKNLLIVGDRVLIDPDEGLDRTVSGLYLPLTVKEKEKATSGHTAIHGEEGKLANTGFSWEGRNIFRKGGVLRGLKEKGRNTESVAFLQH